MCRFTDLKFFLIYDDMNRPKSGVYVLTFKRKKTDKVHRYTACADLKYGCNA